jgi:hypothetical protein
MWNIESTYEVATWANSLSENERTAILEKLLILQEIGPKLGRPFVDTVAGLISSLPPEKVSEAKKKARKEILKINLKEIRQELGIKQVDIAAFSQSSVSKVENKKDMKLSTLVDYLESIGVGIEIKVYPKNPGKGKKKEQVLLKT